MVDFVKCYDLILVSDEIYYDLVFSGVKYIFMMLVDFLIMDCLVMMIVIIKIFNIVGSYFGNVIIFDLDFCVKFVGCMVVFGFSFNSFGFYMVEVVYMFEGVEWVDVLVVYLDGNC